ncbi:MAG: hypothetical protein JXB29_10655 [Sedimentisphaerales bacterium]|nr:hypothetical protein [Sedimentisphaerales bacterium]
MENSKAKTKGLWLLIVASIVLVCCTGAFADNEDKKAEEKEVLTDLEVRMQKRISVDFVNTPIDDVIRIMADQADVDIIKSPKVIGNVTAKLTDVPLQEALNNILAAHGYDYVPTENMIRIAPIGEIAEKAERLVSKVYRITYADVTQLEKGLMRFISKRGSISSNPGTSNLIITETEAKIKTIDTFIEEVDRRTPQILVEARIYDISTTDELDLGLEWYAGRKTDYSGTDGESSVTSLGVDPSGRTNSFITGAFDSAITKTPKTEGLLRFGVLNDSIDIDMMLTANKEKICAKLLASPRVLVLDNEPAEFKIVSEIPFQELTQTTGGGNIGTTEFKEVGVELVVTPHVAREGMIRMHLKPKFSVQTDTVSIIIPQSGGTSITSPQPVVDKRETDTIVLVRDGQTAVLGGLRKQDVSQEQSKVPLLGDIPIIGLLFKFEGEKVINSELVVFVTPRIVLEPTLSPAEKLQYNTTDIEPVAECAPPKCTAEE